MSTIEWTDETWNPTVGCSRVSPGCDGCYAVGVAHRAMQPAHEGLTVRTESGSGPRSIDWTGEVRLLPDRLDTPLRWRKPRRVFVDSMSDLFHPDVPEEFIARVWATMHQAHQHTFQVLTKRPQRMRSVLADSQTFVEGVQVCVDGMYDEPDDQWVGPPWPPRNVWLGTSVENQRYAELRIPHLLATPAAVRFLSIEPLLGPVDLRRGVYGMLPNGEPSGTTLQGIDWVIVGGESGPGARPMHPDWVRSIRDQCVAAGVPFFFKQWGEWKDPAAGGALGSDGVSSRTPACWVLPDGSTRRAPSTCPAAGAVPLWRVGKKAAGRELDGRTWDEMPA